MDNTTRKPDYVLNWILQYESGMAGDSWSGQVWRSLIEKKPPGRGRLVAVDKLKDKRTFKKRD